MTAPFAAVDEVLARHNPPRPGVVVDVAEIDAIAARVAHGELGWWARLTTPAPAGWRQRSPRGDW